MVPRPLDPAMSEDEVEVYVSLVLQTKNTNQRWGREEIEKRMDRKTERQAD